MAQSKVLLELTEQELKQILGTAVKHLVRIASEPTCEEFELHTLGSVIQKCSLASRRIQKVSSPIRSKSQQLLTLPKH